MRFWIDIDNASHVPVLAPIIRELRRRGHDVDITARDYGQTLPLLALHGLPAHPVGRHAGRKMVKKVMATVARTARLLFFAMGRRFDAVLCLGSRGVYTAAWLLRIPIVTLGDYEYASMPFPLYRMPTLVVVADAIPLAAFDKVPPGRVRFFPGLKEDLYVHDCRPDPSFLDEMGIDRGRIIVLMRPPATMAHYAVKESARLFEQALDYLAGRDDLELIVVPRTRDQEAELRGWARGRNAANLHFPPRVYDGTSLVWYSDVVIGGGGTMNREAAALGVPVVSIYEGPLGAVDRRLIEAGRLVHVSSIEELKALPLRKREQPGSVPRSDAGRRLCDLIIAHVLEAVRMTSARPREATAV